MRTALVGCILIGCGVLAVAAVEKNVKDGEIVLQSLKSGEDELVEVKFSDVRFTAKELTFLHQDGSKTLVRAKGGAVELSKARESHSGKEISTIFPNGILSQRVPKIP